MKQRNFVPQLIGLCGNRGVGKDTIADALVNGHGYKKIAFADAIYSAVMEETGVPIEFLQGRAFKESWGAILNPAIKTSWSYLQRLKYSLALKGRPPRQWLLDVADRKKAQFGDLYFVTVTMQRISELRKAGISKVVVTDVRYRREFEALSNFNGSVFRITNPDIDKAIYERVNTDRSFLHNSEQWLVKEARNNPAISVVPNVKRDGGESAAERIISLLKHH